ncbi:hypothetical protein JTB14_022468 [Gonioctena quinquepunctata]|nr:hypothetical protein JTB14_022468 [Gonioctena quinquepunctata]
MTAATDSVPPTLTATAQPQPSTSVPTDILNEQLTVTAATDPSAKTFETLLLDMPRKNKETKRGHGIKGSADDKHSLMQSTNDDSKEIRRKCSQHVQKYCVSFTFLSLQFSDSSLIIVLEFPKILYQLLHLDQTRKTPLTTAELLDEIEERLDEDDPNIPDAVYILLRRMTPILKVVRILGTRTAMIRTD